MSTCTPHFNKFDDNLKLTDGRKAKIIEKYARLDQVLRDDEELRDLDDQGTILQGSYRNHTIVKPRNDGEYDVDICWRIKNPAELGFDSPRKVYDFVVKRLRADQYYKDKIIEKNRCIRIDYAGEFHMDIILMRTDTSCPQVVDYESNEWSDSDPEAFREWVIGTNKEADGTLRRMIRHVREWAFEHFTDDMRPSGIFLTQFVGRHHVLTTNVTRRGMDHRFTGPGSNRRDHAALLADTLYLMYGCWNNRGIDRSMCLPVRPQDDLTDRWSDPLKKKFGEELWKFYENAARACKAATDEDGAVFWREAFGDRFPLKP